MQIRWTIFHSGILFILHTFLVNSSTSSKFLMFVFIMSVHFLPHLWGNWLSYRCTLVFFNLILFFFFLVMVKLIQRWLVIFYIGILL